jgi:hypothetical protein
MHNSHEKESRCAPHDKYFERLKFYFGKLMTVRDFEAEQRYFNEKRWLLNRYGLGWGVLCGLKVIPHPREKCKVIVCPGIALDMYGNEIVVCEEEAVDLVAKSGTQCPSHKYYVSIKYHECLTRPAPVPVEDCGELKSECEYGGIRETYRTHVSCTEPERPRDWHDTSERLLWCERDCTRLLQNPIPLVNAPCPPQAECREIILACVCYVVGKPILESDIDNVTFRKVAFSNEHLRIMMDCMRRELLEGKAAARDRRRYVPLLAETIKGISYRDGKIAVIELKDGSRPVRCMSDGDFIWVTDKESGHIVRVDRRTNKVVDAPSVDLADGCWGLAYHDSTMWITHHQTKPGKITRINVCTLEPETVSAMPDCEDVNDCNKLKEKAPEPASIPPYPQEIVYHRGFLFVSHGWEKDGEVQPLEGKQGVMPEYAKRPILISQYDPERKCLIAQITINPTEDSIPVSRVIAMASDGDVLWVLYEAIHGHKGHRTAVVQKIEANNGKYHCGEIYKLTGANPEHMVFDGTHMWVSHDEGVSRIDVDTGEEARADTDSRQTAIAFGGGEYLWSAEIGQNEAKVNRVDIHSKKVDEWLEIIEFQDKPDAKYSVTDMQFDGDFLYLTARFQQPGQQPRGIIHRLLV